ncbi:hypothetical protein M427DRAFT_68150 [Gonapodya prolifera JEL478]|uniref:BPL/LPL catalytic domain-containing protein n=1 Tax=Gonapodya prolifera (strain JEL478) TaxID=1344416 RepID=A0A139ANC1_GONPJ|nr:hypothetical protein M427DRAFT_68150 [Gonapodya prolifera JEL478]|eukprot:KXS18005.1 hypothetical protein M427DRAFT_68150 [Gonapodya prolifera JEL478]
MNVLVYTGPGTARSSVEHTMATLKELLGSAYDVMAVDAKTILSEPWQDSAAMLVIPGGRDIPYVKELGPKGTELISNYVRKGGRYLGICAGAYFACSRLEFERGRKYYEVIGNRELSFFRGTARGSAFPGFVYDSEEGARAVPIQVVSMGASGNLGTAEESNISTLNIYHNGGCFLVPNPENVESADDPQEVIATYEQTVFDGTKNAPAIALCRVGRGLALITGVHIEFNAELFARAQTDSRLDPGVIPELLKTEQKRRVWLSSVFRKMGLWAEGPVQPSSLESGVKSTDSSDRLTLLERAIAAGPTQIFDSLALVANMDTTGLRVSGAGVVSQYGFPPVSTQHLSFETSGAGEAFMDRLYERAEARTIGSDTIRVFGDLTYEIEFLEVRDSAKSSDQSRVEELIRGLRLMDIKQQHAEARAAQKQTSHVGSILNTVASAPLGKKQNVSVVVHRNGSPPSSVTPGFDHSQYWSEVRAIERKYGDAVPKLRLGRALWYGEVLPSTQTVLDRNPKFASLLRDGFTTVATHQTASRARGRNSWISPVGCLQFSFLLRHPREAPPVVFVQYIVAISTVEAVRSFPGCEDLPVVVKWPNDVYAYEWVDEKDESGCPIRKRVLKKLGGILVNSSYVDNQFVLVAGHGLNVSNRHPSTCLNTLLEQLPPSKIRREPFTQEKVLAHFFHHFARLYTLYRERGFQPLSERYTKWWIHQNQEVGVEGLKGKWKIVGVDSGGHLRCRKIAGEHDDVMVGDGETSAVVAGRTSGEDEEVLLGPDGNGFDMMKGLIVQKR